MLNLDIDRYFFAFAALVIMPIFVESSIGKNNGLIGTIFALVVTFLELDILSWKEQLKSITSA